jgi:hypothetical protein
MKPRIPQIGTDAQAQTEALKSKPFHTKTAKGAKPRRFLTETVSLTISVHQWLKKLRSLRYLCDLGVKRIDISTVKNSRLFAVQEGSFYFRVIRGQ